MVDAEAVTFNNTAVQVVPAELLAESLLLNIGDRYLSVDTRGAGVESFQQTVCVIHSWQE